MRLKINFILLTLIVLATDLLAANKNDDKPIQLDQMGESTVTSLYDFDDSEFEAPEVKEKPAPQPETTKPEPAAAAPVSAAFSEFAEKPSTGPGSNKLDEPAPAPAPVPEHKLEKKQHRHHRPHPRIISKPTLEQPQTERAYTPPSQKLSDKRKRLEDAQKVCMNKVNDAYTQQREMTSQGLSREQINKFQREIAHAHEGCLAMNNAIENINVAEARVKKEEMLGERGLEEYEAHLEAANKAIGGTREGRIIEEKIISEKIEE